MSETSTTYSDTDTFGPTSAVNDEKAFAELYDCYFRLLFNYTFSKVNDRFAAQEIVQELFISIWKQRHTNAIQVSRAYLFASAKNLIISHYRKEYTRQHYYGQWETQREQFTESTDQPLLTSDLQQRYEQGLQLLPPKCKEVFVSSRKGHSNREIAQQLTISEKTVEQHITKALRLLKDYLREHYAYALVYLFTFFD
ncbi:RNA polymerase sigma-70 factor [Spirosoma validum]|uniref:RNA polymerase sigma-70 factor n=1 Tax=Spirosoma validum TaxID=2771355 RepID=A0A927B5K3_9BACT|nr:RNA polymerase sigma-70 factor [Spirosoma validum]MBD2755804.1 RNA polymerase sigma-70 factor [Spirosoma validum]